MTWETEVNLKIKSIREPMLYTENVMERVLGPQQGLSELQMDGIKPRLKEIHKELELKLSDIEVLKKEQMAWMTLWNAEPSHIRLVEEVSAEIRQSYDYLLVIGIGGSSLGAKALLHALNYMGKKEGTPDIVFLENADPETLTAFENTLKEKYGKCDYSHVAVNVISKSGTTAETAANFEIVLEHMKESGLNDEAIAQRMIATTDIEKGTLKKIAREKGLRTLIVPDGVGGRFSVFSDVGLLPLAVGGVHIRNLLLGVKKAFERSCKKSEDPLNHAYQLGSILYLMDEIKGAYLHGLFLFGEAFEGIAAWFEQLWAESLGKDGKGPRPLGMIGVKAQHGVHQDNLAGKRNKVILFVAAEEERAVEKLTGESGVDCLRGKEINLILSASMKIAVQNLTNLGRPNMTLLLPRIDEKYLGELLFTLEMATHVAGRLYGVNPYNQPAVEEAKIGARDALYELQKISKSKKFSKLVNEPILNVEGVKEENIGAKHGLSPEDIENIQPQLKKIHQEIISKLSNPQGLNESWMGWMKVPLEIELKRINDLRENFFRGHELVLVIGMGGAVSGSKAVIHALNYLGKKVKPEIFFIDNADAETWSRLESKLISLFGKIDYAKVIANVISQSGETLETLANLEILLHKMRKAGIRDSDLKNKFIVTTNLKGGILLNWAKKMKCVCLEAPGNMMGLLGVFANTGLLPLAIAGADLKKFRSGMRKGYERALRDSTDLKNFSFRLAESFYLLDVKKNKDLHGFFMYGDAFMGIVQWLEQLWAEALGKTESVGPRPLAMIGTTAQHSVNQDNIAGRNNKVILCLAAQKPRVDFVMPGANVDYLAGNRMSELLLASMEGTLRALKTRERPNLSLMIPQVDEESLGEFLYTMAMTAHILARLYEVDPYLQPLLERGKKEIRQALESFQSYKPLR